MVVYGFVVAATMENDTNFVHKTKRLLSFFKIAPKDVLIGATAISATLSVVTILTYLYFAKDLKSKEAIMNNNNTGLVLLDRNGTPFFKFYQAQYREPVPPNQIPDRLKEAVITAEDKQFYSHPGFSIKAILGALLADLRRQNLDYGGSTITQQLVKNSLLNTKKSILRKYQELVLAQEIERRFSKDDILWMYLNSVYWGEGSFGIEEASEAYFNRPAKDLDLAQSALLAGLLTAPSRLSPISGDRPAAILRQRYILEQMVGQKYISQAEAERAAQEDLTFNSNPQDNFIFRAPLFAEMVKQQLVDRYGEETVARSGFTVITTLDLNWQNFAQQVVSEQVARLRADRVSNGAAVVEDPKTGEIRALVGNKDWNNPQYGKFNVATALRQPGSSFKPIVYAAALEKRVITPATILMDVPTTYKPGPEVASSPYSPRDYDNKTRGPVTVRRALDNSLNIPAVEVMQKTGVPAAVEMARRMGITTLKEPSNYGLSLVLGSAEVPLIEMTNAFAVFANQGQRNDITIFTRITDKQNNIIYQYRPREQRVLDSGVAFLISSILSDNATRSEMFGTILNISRPAAVKTGTSENYRDSLTIGYTPQLTVGVWVGNNDSAPMDQVAGSVGAAPIWKALMEKFLAGTPVEQFSMPPDIVETQICKNNGLLARQPSAATYREYFLRGTEPKAYCNPGISPSANPFPATNQPSDQPVPVTTVPNQSYQTGGWYPVGPGGQALQYWEGRWYRTPQQDRHRKKDGD